jgi:phosphate transport system substrate-binding protein
MARTVLVGSGATFPQPIYTKWFQTYAESHPEFQVRYEGGGSEAGIRRLCEGSIDFAASDMPLDDEQLAQLGRPVLQLPGTFGAVVPSYHLEGFAQDLRRRWPESICDASAAGTIQRSNPRIEVRRFLTAPSRSCTALTAAGRQFIWTDYLSKVSAVWKSKPGTGTSFSWPIGESARGNQGVARTVADTPDAIGYAAFIYALFNRLS